MSPSVERGYGALVYAALATAIVSSLGMLLVPVVAVEMDVPASAAQWMITGNLLLGSLVSPISGRLSDRAGKKALLLWLLGLALTGSVIAALAAEFWVLLAGRVIQGFAYGIVPVSIAIARDTLTAQRSAVAVSTLSITVSMGLGLGYPLTGLVVGVFGLSAAFWAAAAFILSVIVVVLFKVRPGPVPAEHRPFDFVGAILLSGALASVVLTMSEGPAWGWLSWQAILLIVLSVVLGAAWFFAGRRAAHPFVDTKSFRVPEVSIAHVVAFVLAATVYISMSTASLVAQAPGSTGYGLAIPVLLAGLVIFPLSLGSFLVSGVVARLLDRVPLLALLAGAAGVLLLGNSALLLFHAQFWQLLFGMLVIGAGMGAAFGVGAVIVARGVSSAEVASAVAFNQVLRTIGGTIGSAIVGGVFAAAVTAGGFPSAAGVTSALLLAIVGAAACGFALLVYLLVGWRRGGTHGRHGHDSLL